MDNGTLQLKIKQRLNKLASNDYDNIECWQIVEAFNKAQVQWARRQLHGGNMFKEGDEQSKRRIDDLQVLLTDTDTKIWKMVDRGEYFDSDLPADYFEWKRISAKAKDDCCDPRRMMIYQVEEGNINEILRDENKRPSFEWAETIATLKDNKVLIYTDNKFTIVDPILTYYRQPRRIQILGCVDPYTLVASAADITCEFKDDIVEVLIDETVTVLAGDIESGNQRSIGSDSTEKNN